MPVSPPPQPLSLLVEVAARRSDAPVRLRAMLADWSLSLADRLDDRARSLIERRWLDWCRAVVVSLVGDMGDKVVEDGAARLLSGDVALAGELVDAARLQVLGERIARQTDGGPSLLVRLIEGGDEQVAAAARLLLQRRGERCDGAPEPLPSPLHARMIWSWAALLSEPGGADVATRAARLASLPDETALAAATVLAASLTHVSERHELLAEALGDGQVELAAALLGCWLDVSAADGRAILVDPVLAGLCVGLVAAGVDPALVIALPGDADDRLGEIVIAARAITREDAWSAFAPLREAPALRTARQRAARS